MKSDNVETPATPEATFQNGYRTGYEDGRAVVARDVLIGYGTADLGAPDWEIRARLTLIKNFAQFVKLQEALVTGSAKNWKKLLQLI